MTRELVAHVLPPLLQFWKYAPEEDVQAQDQGGDARWLRGCQGNHQGLSYVTEIIKIELTSLFGIEKTRQLVARKNTRPAVGTNTCPPVTI